MSGGKANEVRSTKILENAVLSPDVRKGSALPTNLRRDLRYALMFRFSLRRANEGNDMVLGAIGRQVSPIL